jgi:hypothetical protein
MDLILVGFVGGICVLFGYSLYRQLRIAMDAKKYHEENYEDQ